MQYGNVKIEGGPLSHKTTIIDTTTGEPIKGIAAADVKIRPGEPIEIDLLVQFAEVKLLGKPAFMMADPRTGAMKRIAKIVFADGQVFEPVTE